MAKKVEDITDEEMVKLFNKAISTQEKLQYFSKIRDYNIQLQLLDNISSDEKYKYIGKIKSMQGIAIALNGLEDDKVKSKSFNFIAKQFKGNSEGLLRILTQIDFDVELPTNMLIFQLNNIKALNLDFLINIQKHLSNHSKMKFKINEDTDSYYNVYSRYIEYSFSEISAIIAKIEELTADIPKEMDESNKFYTIYSRIIGIMTYDHNCVEKQKKILDKNHNDYNKCLKELNNIRRNAVSLYGGLVNGKAVCAGYALILNEVLKYIGMKSQYVVGDDLKDAHAWNQVQIDGKWYNVDPTSDSNSFQLYRKYRYMLLNDEDFDISHGIFSRRSKNYRKCTSRFDYSKIKELSPNQIIDLERII